MHRKGLPDFQGLKVCYAGNNLAGYPDIRRIDIDKHNDKLLFEVGKTGSGGNSGFQAFNLTVQWGPPKRILLIGFDMTDASGVHWYGRNTWHQANNPNESNFKRWIAAFETAGPVLVGMGIEVINCSVHSALKCFPRRSIEDALKESQS